VTTPAFGDPPRLHTAASDCVRFRLLVSSSVTGSIVDAGEELRVDDVRLCRVGLSPPELWLRSGAKSQTKSCGLLRFRWTRNRPDEIGVLSFHDHDIHYDRAEVRRTPCEIARAARIRDSQGRNLQGPNAANQPPRFVRAQRGGKDNPAENF
jgi:hypothetical protein